MEYEVQLVRALKEHGLRITTAESLTAGMVAATIVRVPGASAVFDEAFITYSAEAKIKRLGVDSKLIDQKGVINPWVAKEMALGACNETGAEVSIATTGNAGPDVLEYKPVGRVYTAVCINGVATSTEHTFSGDRESIRRQTTNAVLRECLNRLAEYKAPSADAD